MESVLIAVVLAAAPTPAPVGDAVTALDQRCFSLMAELADDQDPRIRSLGRVAAQYFLGRIDAAAPGFDPDAAAPAEPGDHDQLLRRCGDAMQAGGRDFRSIGEALAPGRRPNI
ncbi:MAG: hypothetical protein QOG13_2166 [Sphingomonadales bacterium]|jgi:hypothetical protein|nr:hypothetical protein [Sphingomonadales bacterium]MEA3044841.1 hypothetical protein [Sphingomonadales bacterium]